MFIFDDKFNNSYFTDNPPDPVFFNEPLEPTFIQPLIQNSLPKVNPSSITNHVLQRTTPPKDGLCPLDAVTSCDGSLLSQQPLLSFDDLEWFNTSSSSKASTVSASAPAFAPVAATLPQDDASGFDQLSLLDEICASVSSTPFTSHLDSPDPSHQTPLFDSVASEVLDIAAPNQFWNSADSDINLASSMTAGGLNLDLNLGLISPISSTSPLASTTFLEEKDASDQDLSQAMSRLQAENALLDFVLYDDITHPSPISTLMATPETTSVSSPMFSDSTIPMSLQSSSLPLQQQIWQTSYRL
ncbi:hypothetical protein BCR41DRAFT_195379 [Lobosporangium transversale]|uniref:Uncharacterized protein n=1 Tax=Lobosporangium transversale TaxID=64571 RepID=A0A1Y2GAV5_9FUNG|nr:hypothetical protein BCR41DRAFT_195379 [Lobosporangium transversale]ORZ04557.1 hypothetical protein BCR41DRAFT_195379 [Lobosporangium transversale]|eukprot:XP_021876603.1 hypothetical protein BCR41DRAFT_195379 [Lobosporangium transversale]